MLRSFATLAALLLTLSTQTFAAEPSASAASEPPDYSQAADWICRPGDETKCTANLDAKIETPQGATETTHFEPAKDPPIDCFYVYPTVSQEETSVSDLQQSPEIVDTVNRQAGRLTSKCRVFAPVYRQTTIEGLRKMMRGQGRDDFDVSFGDVASAWEYYLAHDNGGRGVVFVGHSQGTILLQRLLATALDNSSERKLLVSAFFAGDPSLGVPIGKTVGGTFAHIPVCSSKAQTGCVYAWGSYLDNDSSPLFTFGHPLDNGMVSACVNPAAPSGGAGNVEFFHKKPQTAPENDPPWIETVGQISGKCRSDSTGDGFIVSTHGPNAKKYHAVLEESEILSGWGLHLLDVQLVMGNMLDVLDAETATWKASHGP